MSDRNCGVTGHLQKACRTFVRGRPMQLPGERDRKVSEIAAVSTKDETNTEDQLVQNTVSDMS